jgi:7,8-dihydropterin-6-yl-methyl-4-(beta-D-ribofuranosyl)aminobenzene 5'-phosphate synthase
MIQLSHWHRDHSGGMLKATSLISSARKAFNHPPPIIDLHPNRPAYRGWQTHDKKVISLQADPKFEGIENSGGVVRKEEAVHAVLDDFFCVSGFIPITADYETGLRSGMRWVEEKKEWISDEEIADERFLMCNLKGTLPPFYPSVFKTSTRISLGKGLVLLTGCSHRGVVSASREALRLTNHKIPLHAILGGYHLAGSEQKDNTKVELTVNDLKQLDPKVLLPGHCSGWRVKMEIEKSMPGRLVPCTVGSRYAF